MVCLKLPIPTKPAQEIQPKPYHSERKSVPFKSTHSTISFGRPTTVVKYLQHELVLGPALPQPREQGRTRIAYRIRSMVFSATPINRCISPSLHNDRFVLTCELMRVTRLMHQILELVGDIWIMKMLKACRVDHN